jgi:hypothetical protein
MMFVMAKLSDVATERVYKFVEEKLIEKTREVEEELKRGK